MREINLIHGDCLEKLKDLEDNSVDSIVTDPPYKMTARGNSGNSGGMFLKDINKSGKVFNHNDILISEWLPHCYRVLKESSHIYIMTNHINLHEYLNIIKSTGFHFIKSLIWNKGNKIMSQYYMSQFEYILFCRKGFAKKINNCGTSDIIDIPNKKQKNSDGLNLHDTEKPVSLMEVLIQNSSIEKQTILDPFMGIGSTGLACKNINRNFIGIEMDKNYFDIAKNRIEQTLI